MSGSKTTAGQLRACESARHRVAFRYANSVSTLNNNAFAAQWLTYAQPLSTLSVAPHATHDQATACLANTSLCRTFTCYALLASRRTSVRYCLIMRRHLLKYRRTQKFRPPCPPTCACALPHTTLPSAELLRGWFATAKASCIMKNLRDAKKAFGHSLWSPELRPNRVRFSRFLKIALKRRRTNPSISRSVE